VISTLIYIDPLRKKYEAREREREREGERERGEESK